MKYFVLLLCFVFMKNVSFGQNISCDEIFISSGDLVLVSNRTGAELGLTEKEGSFISNVGKPDKVYSDKDGDSGYYMAITKKEFNYAKDWFVFHFVCLYNTYEGLRDFNMEDIYLV